MRSDPIRVRVRARVRVRYRFLLGLGVGSGFGSCWSVSVIVGSGLGLGLGLVRVRPVLPHAVYSPMLVMHVCPMGPGLGLCCRMRSDPNLCREYRSW